MRNRLLRRLSILVALAALATGIVTAHGRPWPVPEAAKKRKNQVAASEEALRAAKTTYERLCASCHGASGKGDGPEAQMYEVKPADFTDAHMMGEMTDGEIYYKMSEGRDPMPAFKMQLSEEQRWQMVHYLRSFAARSGKSGAASHQGHRPAKKSP
jgi:mono/diheme cytochrome c family protein